MSKKAIDLAMARMRFRAKPMPVTEHAKAITIEERQAILDLLHEGKTIGEIKKIANCRLDVVCGVIELNTETHSFLRRESL